MMVSFPNVVLVAVVLSCGVCFAADGETAGEKLYYEFACYACHGYGGTGRTPLSKDVSGVLSQPDVFLTYLRLRADQNPVNPKNSMPNYSAATLSDQQALDIYAYLVSLDNQTPDIEDIPIMQKLIEDAERRVNFE